jgi:tRNA G18 (ribose-2'-O)-methylase SpoU
MNYIFLQCRNEACRFRFPADRRESAGITCPRCRSPLVEVGEALHEPLARREMPSTKREVVALLDNIRSIHNVGSMFRSADGAGIARLILAGITATPEHPKLQKAALGAQESINWQYCPNGVDAALALRGEGYRLVALERLSAGRESLSALLNNGEPLALVVGNERAGIDPGILGLCDAVLTLPMMGHKSSLNAAVAFGIALYYLQFGDQYR